MMAAAYLTATSKYHLTVAFLPPPPPPPPPLLLCLLQRSVRVPPWGISSPTRLFLCLLYTIERGSALDRNFGLTRLL
eukprot:CAMPEP_0175025238 /NCGR_PEP_ID=MMETSP0005-20121125/16986_1 /TAXON_ID=420556 /ORGANISM="Ochromonas sp., Strain CCMP1393" /LENGTH=76 /DNA_ID=CAMNT_0016284029 /DNA_START=154 /DNA_END=384 /DNA_ORIENTATION=+